VKQHLNTLYVTTQEAYLAKDGAAVSVRVDGESRLRVPLLNLGGIVCFGNVTCSPFLMEACADAGVAVSFLTERGRFLANVQGFTPGNVLLRRAQYRRADDLSACTSIARNIVRAKIANSRQVLLRAVRDYPDAPGRPSLERAAAQLRRIGIQSRDALTLDGLRGMEGDAAGEYFGVFNHLITSHGAEFQMAGRSRRPPRDPVNALLSFLYVMLSHDTRAACEAVGLDAAVGFLHRDRPGRPGLALDLMEEVRAFLVDRLVLSLINRGQVKLGGFRTDEAGGVAMDDETRRAVLIAYQERKQDTITHPFLKEEITLGLIVHIQARLLARHLRGDLDAYPPFVSR
jgi:CRISPR-associated protein Cas1